MPASKNSPAEGRAGRLGGREASGSREASGGRAGQRQSGGEASGGRGGPEAPAGQTAAAARAAYDRVMPRRLAAGTARDLVRAERDIRGRIGDQPLDFAAMAAVSNIYRAANVIRNHMERKVLADEDLSWAAFTVMFVLWIWGDQQTRHLAAEAGVTKGTLTGVLKTLEKRGLARRRAHEADGRLVLVGLEPKGVAVIERLFPAFNMGEAFVSASLTEPEKQQLASLLRKIIRSVEDS
jgi:MarR family transcriptional regulator, organic hydroperoxide resistance regulator